MKKTLVVLLILAVAGGVFAQEVTISGSVNTGLEGRSLSVDTDVSGADKISDWAFGAYAHDADVDAYRFDVNIDAEVNENVSAHVKLRSQEGGYRVGIEYAYGKATAFSIVDIYGGKVDNGAWATKGDKADDVGEGLGGLIQVRPIEGLNLGAGVYTSEYGLKTSSGDYNRADFLAQKFAYGFSYTMADTFRAEASARTVGRKLDAIFAGAEILMIPNLTLAVEGYSETLPAKDIGWTFDVVGAYKINDALDAGATLWLLMNQIDAGFLGYAATKLGGFVPSGTSSELFGFKGKLWASYALLDGVFVPKLEIYGGYNTIGKKLTGASGDAKALNIGAKPSITWNVAENAKVVGAYAFDWGSIDMGTTPAQKPSATQHTIYVDFIYSF